MPLERVTKAPEEEGAGVGEAAGEAAERAQGAIESLGGHGGGHGGSHGAGHGGAHGGHAGAAHEGHGEAHGGHAGGHGAGHEGGHAAGGEGHGGGHAEKPKHEKPKGGGGGDRPRDEHGRFAGKRARFKAAAAKSYEAAWGAPFPSYDQLAAEEGDMDLNRSQKVVAPLDVAEPDDLGTQEANGAGLGTGRDFDEMAADWNEVNWDEGSQASNDPDLGGDGGIDESLPMVGDENAPPDLVFGPFDAPYQTQLRSAYKRAAQRALKHSPPGTPATLQANPSGNVEAACPQCGQPMRDSAGAHQGKQRCDACGFHGHVVKATTDGAAEGNAGGDGLDDHPWGEPTMFDDPGAFEGVDDAWIAARAKGLPDAALLVCFDDAGRVLTVTRPEPPHEFSIPGGIVDPGEDPATAAIREALEECDIEATIDDPETPACVITSPTDGRKVYVFVAASWHGTPRAAEPDTEIAMLRPSDLLAQAQLYRASVRQLMANGVLAKGVLKSFPSQLRSPVGTLAGALAAMARVRKDDPGVAVQWAGIPIVIDRPKGYVQRGTAPDGSLWERTYLCDYGYIPGTSGGDGEGLDVYLGELTESPLAHWILQVDDDGAFDEYKLVLGAASLEDAVGIYLAHTPPQYLGVAFSTDLGSIKALLGQDPGEVIKACGAIHVEALMATAPTTTRKDAMPAGPGGQPNGDDDATPQGGGGADLVEIANERLSGICDSIEAAGGILTPELKDEVSNVVALLEAVAPDDDDDLDDEEEGVAPMGPGQGAPVTARDKRLAEKRAAIAKWRAGKASLVGKLVAKRMGPEAFISAVAKQLLRLSTTKHAGLRKVRAEGIRKMLTYGTEVFGNEANFQATGSDTPAIPMYTEAFVDSHTEEVPTPGEESVKANWTYDPKYTPNDNSQQAFDAGSPNLAENVAKRLQGVRAKLKKAGPAGDAAGAMGAPIEPADETTKGAACGPDGKPVKKDGDDPEEGAAGGETQVVDKGSNVEKDTWTTAYVNELPDSAFLYVEGGGSKDADGRTTPRDLRHFPYKDQSGKVDLPHLRDAVGRIPQSGLPDDKKKELQAHAQSMLGDAEKAQKSDVQKALRSDDGWPDDLADPKFLTEGKAPKTASWGYDDLPSKVEKAEKEQTAAAAGK